VGKDKYPHRGKKANFREGPRLSPAEKEKNKENCPDPGEKKTSFFAARVFQGTGGKMILFPSKQEKRAPGKMGW